jgi:ribosome biogenesis GTPase
MMVDILDAAPEEIADAFPEFHTLDVRCRFDDCRHKSEPDCAVKKAVEAGAIAARRHQSYLILSAEAEAAEKR